MAGVGLGGFYFGYGKALGSPVRVGVIGTGDEGSVLIGAINPDFIEVRSICDIRPYNRYRAFHGEVEQPARPGLMSVYGWKSEAEARRHVRVYEGSYEELIQQRQEGRRRGGDHRPALAPARPGGHRRHAGRAARDHREAHGPQRPRVQGDGPRRPADPELHLATGHQRHYNILYAQAMDQIQRGLLGELHYIRAQWHRSNLPGTRQLAAAAAAGGQAGGKEAKASKKLTEKLKEARSRLLAAATGEELRAVAEASAQLEAQIADAILHTEQGPHSGKTLAETLGYESRKIRPGGTIARPSRS